MHDTKSGLLVVTAPYNLPAEFPAEIVLGDHLGGFDSQFNNSVLEHLNQYCANRSRDIVVHHHTIMNQQVQRQYPHIKFKWMFDAISSSMFDGFQTYRCHPRLQYHKFVSSFNGSDHVSRKLLVAALGRRGWFDPETCSKNFSFTVDTLDGHLLDYLTPQQHAFYRQLFIGADSGYFFDSVYSFGHVRHQHNTNIVNLEQPLTQSFVQVVSESMATSHHPFVTEKFLYSVVTRGLFVSYAQPQWHSHLEQYFGFRKYNHIFDYEFDTIANPIQRLVALMDMLSKFANLSSHDWHSLYELERDTIEFNYQHYFSQDYLKVLNNHA
jgi:hypothetical protein